MKGIPFSEHSVRSRKAQSLFPTLERDIEKANQSLESSDRNLYRDATAILRLGGQGLPHVQTISEKVALEHDNEELQIYNSNHINKLFSPQELFYQKEFERVQELKRCYDRLRTLKNAKHQQLRQIQDEVQHRDEQDRTAAATIDNGKLNYCLIVA
jgi:hypothetical protein